MLEIDRELGSSPSANRACFRPANDPAGVVGRRFVGIIAREEDPVRLLRKGRNSDRPHRDEVAVGRHRKLSQFVVAIDAAHQVQSSGFEPAVADIDEVVAGGDRSARRYKRLDPDQQSLAARRVTDLRHVASNNIFNKPFD